MKQLFTFILMYPFVTGISQVPIPSYTLSIGYQMTTNIIFPYRIEKADIGSAEVIGQKGGKLDNVLFIKAQRRSFSPTNLSVYTSDGKFYSFILKYCVQPDTLNISFVGNQAVNAYPTSEVTGARMDSDAALIAHQAPTLHKHTHAPGIRADLNGIFIKDHLLWFWIEIKNSSQVDYTPEYLKLFIRDKHTAKRTAVQENEKMPVWKPIVRVIAGQSKATIVFALPPFTLNRQKRLVIQLSEKNGDQMLTLPISAKTLLHCKQVHF